jgi:hypothetical protein
MTEKEQREMFEAARKGEPIRPELLEALRKMEGPEPSRRPPAVFIVYVVFLVVIVIYLISTGGKPTTDAELKRMLRETQQEDARKELERAAEAYRRTLIEPSPSR